MHLRRKAALEMIASAAATGVLTLDINDFCRIKEIHGHSNPIEFEPPQVQHLRIEREQIFAEAIVVLCGHSENARAIHTLNVNGNWAAPSILIALINKNKTLQTLKITNNLSVYNQLEEFAKAIATNSSITRFEFVDAKNDIGKYILFQQEQRHRAKPLDLCLKKSENGREEKITQFELRFISPKNKKAKSPDPIPAHTQYTPSKTPCSFIASLTKFLRCKSRQTQPVIEASISHQDVPRSCTK